MKWVLRIIDCAPYVDVQDFVLQNPEMAWDHFPFGDSFDADVRVGGLHELLKNCRPLHAQPSV
jgi:hypothetical protein